MEREEILKFLYQNKDIFVKRVLKQRWKQDRYSYLLTPRQDHGLMLLLLGKITFVFDDKKLIVNEGDVIFLPKNSFYEAIFENGAEDYLVNFDFNENIVEKLPDEITLLAESALDTCSKAFSDLIDETFLKNTLSFRTHGLFFLLLDSISRHSAESDSENMKLIQKVKGMLYGADELSLEEIAVRCGISGSGLRKKFKKSVGISPTEYRTNAKLSRAKNLLESTDMTVNEISDKLNFYDAAYFCKVFKRHVGVTPKEYLKNKRL